MQNYYYLTNYFDTSYLYFKVGLLDAYNMYLIIVYIILKLIQFVIGIMTANPSGVPRHNCKTVYIMSMNCRRHLGFGVLN